MEGLRSIVIAVFSTSSGCGKTVTAINLAAGLAKEGYRTCLVDLDLQFGDVMGYLDLVSNTTLADAQRALEKDEGSFQVERYLAEYSTGGISFSVMPPPRNINDAYMIDVDTVVDIIQSMTGYNFIVLDMTSAFSALNLAMLDMSTIINFMGVIDFLPSVKNFKVGYDTLLRFDYEESKICLVESKADDNKFINYKDVERLLGAKFYHRLPNDEQAATRGIRTGKPLMFADPLSALSQSYWNLVGRYTNRNTLHGPFQQGEDEQEEKKHAFSWLMRMGKWRTANGAK